VALGAVAGALAIGHVSLRGADRLLQAPDGSRARRLAPVVRALGDGVRETVRQLRHGGPLLYTGIFGYMLFDVLVLWAGFRAFGSTPELTIVWIAYLIGQLGNLIPIPGGFGGTEGGLIGTLALYGLSAVTSTAAVLLYRVIELWVPAVLGLVAFVQLRRLLRRELDTIEFCQPGEIVEVIGAGMVIPKPRG
jgi:uncharacterized protein (TIRG00374 family)